MKSRCFQIILHLIPALAHARAWGSCFLVRELKSLSPRTWFPTQVLIPSPARPWHAALGCPGQQGQTPVTEPSSVLSGHLPLFAQQNVVTIYCVFIEEENQVCWIIGCSSFFFSVRSARDTEKLLATPPPQKVLWLPQGPMHPSSHRYPMSQGPSSHHHLTFYLLMSASADIHEVQIT